ncbi:MAG: hypothetical protein H8E12_15405 [Rhodobacteraceae bacterium]|nr:hypothetical protein [Paracoccaceae bacterium]
MKHSIIITKRDKNTNQHFIDTRYDLDETEICDMELKKNKETLSEEDLEKFEYTAEIEETII